MKRLNSENSEIRGDSSKRPKTETDLKNHRLSQIRTPLNSQSPRLGFGHLNGGRGSGFSSGFSEDILPSNLNVWSAFCRNSTLTNTSPWDLVTNDNQQDQHAFTRPDAFFALENQMHTIGNLPNGQNDKLSKDIWYHFINSQQPGKMYRQKIELWCELDRVLGPCISCSSHAFGSTLNGFGSNESDLDLCLFFNSNATTDKEKNKIDLDILNQTRNILRKQCASFLRRNMELIPAKVPILKLYDNYGRLEVDLSCNNPLSINNTHLLFCYSQLDWRVRPIVITLKTWAKSAGINDAKNQTLSSYTLTLMVIHYLQAGVTPAVLPSLQALYPQVFGCMASISNLSFLGDLPTYKSHNTMTLGQLLTAFFFYYDNEFDFTRDAGSVRTGTVLPINDCQTFARQNQLGPRQWEAYICMEEPFDRTNAGRAVIRREGFDQILKAINIASKKIGKSGQLAKIFAQNQE